MMMGNPYYHNPYYHNPFMSNPYFMMMMGINSRPTNPFEGNGLLHPVYISPLMMHKLEQSVPEWKDPNYENAKEGNLDCIKGATVSCMDSGQKTRSVTPEGVVKLKELQVPEKISCFAGCADVNPCDNNLYSSFVQSEHACDGSSSFYYTCESFEEMDVFGTSCAKHFDPGAKIDAPITTVDGNSNYKVWESKVMKNREQGKGRDIMYDDDEVEPGMGVSVGEGNAGDAPITDEELGNVLDDTKYTVDRAKVEEIDYNSFYQEYDSNYNNNNMDDGDDGEQEDMMGYDGYDVFNEYNGYKMNNNHHDTLELMIMSVWGILFSIIFLCICCVIAGFCGYGVRKLRKRMMGKERKDEIQRGGYIDISDRNDSDDESDIDNNNQNEDDRLYEDSLA